MNSSSSSKTEYTSDESIYERGVGTHTKKRKPKNLSHEERIMLISLYERVKNTWPANKHRSTTAMLQRTSEISGISEYVLYPILKEILESKTAKKSILKKNSAEVTKLNSSEKSAITKLVHDFYLQGELPTIYKVYYALRDDANLPNVSMKTLKGVLRHLRFKYLLENNTVLLQSNGSALRRINYVQNVLKLRNENKNICFVDNTSVKTGMTSNNENKYLNIVIAGNEEWFLEGTGWVFESNENQLSPELFEMWFGKVRDTLENGVVVMKKASFNSRLAEGIPTKVWAKEDIKNWLLSKNVTVPSELNNKACFLSLVEQVKKDHKSYAIEEMAKSKGITVLRTPKYHNELNPFEPAWPIIKNHIVKHLNSLPISLSSAKVIVNNALIEVTPHKWKKFIDQVKSAELGLHKLDQNIDDTTDSYLKFLRQPCFPGDEISSGSSESEQDFVF